jgi:hypothetical protein
VVQDIRDEWQEKKGYNFPDAMFNEIIGQIMNLRQRTPEDENAI